MELILFSFFSHFTASHCKLTLRRCCVVKMRLNDHQILDHQITKCNFLVAVKEKKHPDQLCHCKIVEGQKGTSLNLRLLNASSSVCLAVSLFCTCRSEEEEEERRKKNTGGRFAVSEGSPASSVSSLQKELWSRYVTRPIEEDICSKH